LNILSLFYNKIYKTKNTESSIILNKIRSLLGGSSEHGFREHRPCYIHGRTHVGISDVAKCGKGILAHKPNKIILFTVTILTSLAGSEPGLYKLKLVSQWTLQLNVQLLKATLASSDARVRERKRLGVANNGKKVTPWNQEVKDGI